MDVFAKLRNLKTLLIDDDELIRDSFDRVFKTKGCALMPLETAEEGLKVLVKDRFDVLICDFRLPGISGLEFFKVASQIQPAAVKLLITAYGDDQTASEALKQGVHAIIEKPFSPETIMESLKPLL